MRGLKFQHCLIRRVPPSNIDPTSAHGIFSSRRQRRRDMVPLQIYKRKKTSQKHLARHLCRRATYFRGREQTLLCSGP